MDAVTTKKDAHLARLRERYPDKEFVDDEEIYGQISDDYDQYEQELAQHRENGESLSKMFSADPRSAQFLADMHNGQDPVVGMIRNFGLEIRDVLDDPEMQEQIKEANKEYVERVAASKRLDEEYERNLENSLETLRQFQEERGLSEEQIDEVMDNLLTIVQDGVMGKFDPETLDMMVKAINHDEDVALANDEGLVAGRNARITEQLRKSQQGDGTSPLAGSNVRPPEASDNASIFDLANEAM